MTKPTELFERILPCDIERPYAFISYSHADGACVWADVIALQEMGYNIWIDRNVNPTEERSWNEATKACIVNINCRLVLFYTSKHSLISEPCKNELDAANSSEAKATHLKNPVPVIKVDVKPIPSLEQFEHETYYEILDNTALPSTERSVLVRRLRQTLAMCFPGGNSTVRMLSKDDPKRERDYYQEMDGCFKQKRITQFTPDDMYRNSIKLLQDRSQYNAVLRTLEYCTERNHTYAPLLLAYLLKTGFCDRKDMDQANLLLLYESSGMAGTSWLEQANEKKKQTKREEAVALYLAHGMMNKDPNAFLTACKLWFNMSPPNYDLAEQCLLDAQALGSKDVQTLLRGLAAYKNKS